MSLIVLVNMTLWALLGNHLYNGIGGDYSYPSNWFFVMQDPFYILPEKAAQWVMPILAPMAFFIADLLLHEVYFKVKKIAVDRRI